MTNVILYALVFLPMAAAVIVYLAEPMPARAKNLLLILCTGLVFAMSLYLTMLSPAEVSLGALCSFGAALSFGGFRTVMAIVTASIWFLSSLITPSYFKGRPRSGRYYAFSLFVLGATMGVFLARDLFTLFIFFELMSLSSYVWVAHNESPFTERASQTYLYVGIIGGLAMLTGIILLYSQCGVFTLEGILAASHNIPASTKMAAGICMLTGFGAKAGMFPLHIWLPSAHPAAPAPGSVLLSSVLTKSGVFGVVLVSSWFLSDNTFWGNLLLLLAVCTMFFGALLALFSTDMKRTLACSSMSQIGFILVGVAMSVLLGDDKAMAVSGAVLHLLNHSFIKTGLFTFSAIVLIQTGTSQLNAVKGFGRGKWLLMLCFFCLSASVAGIPGFSGYISKTLLHESIVEYIHHLHHHGHSAVLYSIVEWVFLLSGGMTLAYMSRLFYILFLANASKEGKKSDADCGLCPVVIAVCAALMPALGLTAHASMDRLAAYSAEIFNGEAVSGVHYFSLVNLKGALISIGIGTLIFLFVGMKWLTRRTKGEELYLDRWPQWLSIENRIYRPALSLLSLIGTVFARGLETLGAALVLGPINLVFYKAESNWRPGTNLNFGTYKKQPKQNIVQQTMSYDLILACLGVAVFLIFALLAIF